MGKKALGLPTHRARGWDSAPPQEPGTFQGWPPQIGALTRKNITAAKGDSRPDGDRKVP